MSVRIINGKRIIVSKELKARQKQSDIQIEKQEFELENNTRTIDVKDEDVKKRNVGKKIVVSDITPEDNADLFKLDPRTSVYRQKRNTRLCCCCSELATKLVTFHYDGVQLIERYCNTHVKEHSGSTDQEGKRVEI